MESNLEICLSEALSSELLAPNFKCHEIFNDLHHKKVNFLSEVSLAIYPSRHILGQTVLACRLFKQLAVSMVT